MNELWLFPLSWFIIWLAMNKFCRACWVACLTGAIAVLIYAFSPNKWCIESLYLAVGLIIAGIYPFIRDMQLTKKKDKEEERKERFLPW
ncbi:hypothetical protein ACFLYL_04435 [Chloroflexota bacterium]